MDSEKSPSILVGCSDLKPNAGRYFDQFSVVEYYQTFLLPPRSSTLKKLRKRAPDGFTFITRAWQLITHESTSPTYKQMPRAELQSLKDVGHFRLSSSTLEAFNKVVSSAQALESPVIFFETPVSFSPSSQNIAQMRSFFTTIERHDLIMVWSPNGLWSQEDHHEICAELDLVPCIDPLATDYFPDSDVAYFKIQGLGSSHGISESRLIDLSHRLNSYAKAFCIFNTSQAHKDASRLQSILDTDVEDAYMDFR